MEYIFPTTLALLFSRTVGNKSADIQWCLCSKLGFQLAFCVSCPSLHKVFEWWSPFFNPRLLLSRKKHTSIITNNNSTYHFPGKCYFKMCLFFRLPSLIYPPFHLQSFCVFLLICFCVSTELSSESVLSFFFPAHVSGFDLCFPPVLVLSIWGAN